MKLAWILIVLAALYLGVTYARFRYALTHANLATIKQADQNFGAGPKLKYVAAGDSTAVGEGASSVEKTYTYRLAQYWSTNHQVEYQNIAVIGATTQDVIDHQLAEIIADQPDVITISIGANDITHWTGSEQILKNYETIVAKLTQETRAQIYITDIAGLENAQLLPVWYRNYLDWRARGLNHVLLTFATNRVRFVDIHDFGWSSYPDIRVTFAADQFHPNDEGYNNWTNAFLSKIKIDYQ